MPNPRLDAAKLEALDKLADVVMLLYSLGMTTAYQRVEQCAADVDLEFQMLMHGSAYDTLPADCEP